MHRITIPIRIQSMSIIQHSSINQFQLLAVLSMGLLVFGWTIQYNKSTTNWVTRNLPIGN